MSIKIGQSKLVVLTNYTIYRLSSICFAFIPFLTDDIGIRTFLFFIFASIYAITGELGYITFVNWRMTLVKKEDRTKFFDFIVPVIPYMNETNSDQVMNDLLKIGDQYEPRKEEEQHEISKEYVKQVYPYIGDMRLLINTINEFWVYKRILKKDTQDKLNDEKMMSLMIYKNSYPQDFAALEEEKGVVKEAFEQKERLIREKEEKLKCKKENINKFDSLFVCNPNNPNGKVKNLEKLLDIIVDNNKLLIVDETFMEFVEEEEKYSLVKYVEKYPNLFILKAVTKFFGLPGIRLGYGLTSNNDIIEKIYNYKEPWTINSFADTLSNYIFKDQKYIEDSKEYYIDERNFMLSELKSINSIHVYDTDTNFILIRLNDKRAMEIKVELLREGNILIRDASNFIGLDDRYIRIAIKSHKENELLIRHMKKLLGD